MRSRLVDSLASLGATVVVAESGEVGEEWAREHAPLDVLVYDAGHSFGTGAEEGLRVALEQAWEAVHAVVAGALIPGERAGKVVLIGPLPLAGAHAEAVRAALENLARTLSVEWARYGITVTMIAPGETTSDDELELLVAFLASIAGDYFTGCRFELSSV
jgi:NAD(P)-dependent dehydrogenase (short-subunit alcohol dehydrogenase family)